MGVLTPTATISRYRVEGELQKPVLETAAAGLTKHAVQDIDGDPMEKIVGWASFEDPFKPEFEGSSFSIGEYMIFSLRIDKKTIPKKIVKKYIALEEAKVLAETGREHLSANERQMIKDHVVNVLSLRIPATPNFYDVLWKYEEGELWFFSTQKGANEELENLFGQSFGVTLIRLFPYTMANLTSGLSDRDLDDLAKLSPTSFSA